MLPFLFWDILWRTKTSYYIHWEIGKACHKVMHIKSPHKLITRYNSLNGFNTWWAMWHGRNVTWQKTTRRKDITIFLTYSLKSIIFLRLIRNREHLITLVYLTLILIINNIIVDISLLSFIIIKKIFSSIYPLVFSFFFKRRGLPKNLAEIAGSAQPVLLKCKKSLLITR